MKSEANKNTIKFDPAYQMTVEQNEWYEAQIGACLEKNYRGYLWFVHVENGIVQVTCPSANKEYGFTISLRDLHDTGNLNLHKIMLAGGEILERHRLNRVRANHEVLANAPRNIKDNMYFDD